MNKVKKLSFEGKTIYCGLDAHKTNWKINFGLDQVEVRGFSQDPDPKLLRDYFRRNYPGAAVKVVYEAGFSGFETQRSLTDLGIDCIVVNAADVASKDKDRKRKDDKRDARKLRRELAAGSLEGIFIPDMKSEQDRTLVRTRHQLVVDQTRCKNRIRHMLMFSGVSLEIQQKRWSLKYIKELEEMECRTPSLKQALSLKIQEYKSIRSLIKEATVAIRKLSYESPYADIQPYLQSIDGVGLINGMVIQTEIQDIKRFKTLDSLCDYAGFVPDIKSSNDKAYVRGITHRCNEYLREALIESSWMMIRKDPAMLMKYSEYKKRMSENNAIIRISKHLLSRIRHMWNNKQKYERGIL